MKVILLDYVYKHGVAGEVIDVADGFARNYLIPQKLATKATPSTLKRATKLREQSVVRRAAMDDQVNELSHIINGVELVFGRRAAVTGKLFGSVTTQEIADALQEKIGIDINRRRISQQALRELGTHDVPVRMGTEISPILKITIVRNEELVEYLAKLEAKEAATSEEATDEEANGDQASSDQIEENVAEMATEILPASKVKEQIEKIQAEEAAKAEETVETDDAAE